jgi:hypothetical protein
MTPPVINPLLQILRMESGDGGTAGAVGVATLAKKKLEKGPQEAARPSRSQTTSGQPGVETPRAQSSLTAMFVSRSSRAGHQVPTKGHEAKRPLPSSAPTSGRDVEAEAVAKDDSDDVEAEAVAEDDSDDNKGASIGQPRCKIGAATGGRGTMVVTG